MLMDIFILVIGALLGIVISLFLKLNQPLVAGELIVDTVEWDVDKYYFHLNKIPLAELTDYKYIALKVKQAAIPDSRELNNDSNETD